MLNRQLLEICEDTAKNGHYSEHLAEVSNKGNTVFTTEDIYNEKGILLAKKGIVIDKSLRDNLLKHKLLKPIDHQVGLDSQLNSNNLIARFHQLNRNYPDIAKINKSLNFDSKFELILQETIHPIIFQKLTVLDTQMNNEFNKCLFSAWLSCLISCELSSNKEDTYNTLIASFLHDTGMMHISPDIVNSNKQLTPDEWKTVQAHVVIGKIIADAVPDLSPDVSRGIAEHHETCFGSGYPFAISGFERANLGRILGMSDSIFAIRTKNFKNQNRTLGDIKPYLQLNSRTQSYDVYCAMMSVIKKANLKPTQAIPPDLSGSFSKKLSKTISILSSMDEAVVNVFSQLYQKRKTKENDKTLSTIMAILRRMIATNTESGIMCNELIDWLNEVSQMSDFDTETLNDLNDLELLTNELIWQLRNTLRMASSYSEKLERSNPDSRKTLLASLEIIQNNLNKLEMNS